MYIYIKAYIIIINAINIGKYIRIMYKYIYVYLYLIRNNLDKNQLKYLSYDNHMLYPILRHIDRFLNFFF